MRLSAAAAMAILRNAFLPFHCGASTNTFEDTIRFRIVDLHETQLAALDNVGSDEYGNSESLERLITQLRSDLSDHLELQLDAWHMPDNLAGEA